MIPTPPPGSGSNVSHATQARIKARSRNLQAKQHQQKKQGQGGPGGDGNSGLSDKDKAIADRYTLTSAALKQHTPGLRQGKNLKGVNDAISTNNSALTKEWGVLFLDEGAARRPPSAWSGSNASRWSEATSDFLPGLAMARPATGRLKTLQQQLLTMRANKIASGNGLKTLLKPTPISGIATLQEMLPPVQEESEFPGRRPRTPLARAAASKALNLNATRLPTASRGSTPSELLARLKHSAAIRGSTSGSKSSEVQPAAAVPRRGMLTTS